VLQAAYGYEVKGENDFYIDLVHKAMQPLLLVVHASGNFLVEFLPALKHIPGKFLIIIIYILQKMTNTFLVSLDARCRVQEEG
jgi:hypothetical protein